MYKELPKWRNWQTRTTQTRVPPGVWVRFPPSALPQGGALLSEFGIAELHAFNELFSSDIVLFEQQENWRIIRRLTKFSQDNLEDSLLELE